MSNIGWADALKAKKEHSIILKTYNNDLCPCKSQKKYKHCCKSKYGKNKRFKYTFKAQ